MGGMADALLSGDFDEETGEYIGGGQGFPRSLQREARERKEQNLGSHRGIDAAKNGIQKFLLNVLPEEFELKDTEKVITAFLDTIDKSKYQNIGYRKKVVAVSSNFNEFRKYIYNIYKKENK